MAISDGLCMRCQSKPPSDKTDTLRCGSCGTDWHVPCLSSPLDSLASAIDWKCPDCSEEADTAPVSGIDGGGSVLIAAIRAIEADESLTPTEKAKKRQELMSGKVHVVEKNGPGDGVLDAFRENLNCSICIQLLERPVTTPCGHNFCLRCFEKWIGQGKLSCAKCRTPIPKKTADNPRINSALVSAIRLAKLPKSNATVTTTPKAYHFISNKDRPDKAFTTERAKKTGKANAASGKIYVTIPPDHFGPITAVNDPGRERGVLVGDFWEDRLECRQWGAHFPHVAGIAGQSDYGAQSVALSGGYIDDEDHGEWFLYTGSGGRDLSGNKRTNKNQSFDQVFEKSNEALKMSCKMGYPVRVVRSHKEKRSAYAPADKGVRYDGVYRIEKCWRKVGVQGSFKVCRYLFVRCDNDPAPWTSDEHGDRPRPLPNIPELKKATDLFVRKGTPSWDFDESDGRWKWMKPAPASRKSIDALEPKERKRMRKSTKTVRDKLLKEFGCQICRKVMTLPVTTPCAHNFCKACLEGKFAGITQVRERSRGGRSLRVKKNMKKCPCCTTDLSEFLENPQVNREVMDLIENLKKKEGEENSENATASSSGSGNTESEEEEEEEETQVVSDEVEPTTKKMKLTV